MLVLLVRHAVDARAQRRSAVTGVELLQAPAVLDGGHVPPRRLEHAGEPARRDVRDDAIQRLAVEIDDPQHLSQVRDDRVDQGLPDRALVEFGVTDERHLPSALRHVEVSGHVAVRERAPDRGRRTDAHRARREVRGHGVLETTRVALQPAELAQRRQVLRVELAEQVLDGVQDRRSVRLDRDAVGAAQMMEVQRRHDRDHRRRRRLVSADLHARRRVAHLVGVMDDGRREPQHPVLDRAQRVHVDGWRHEQGRVVGDGSGDTSRLPSHLHVLRRSRSEHDACPSASKCPTSQACSPSAFGSATPSGARRARSRTRVPSVRVRQLRTRRHRLAPLCARPAATNT